MLTICVVALTWFMVLSHEWCSRPLKICAVCVCATSIAVLVGHCVWWAVGR